MSSLLQPAKPAPKVDEGTADVQVIDDNILYWDIKKTGMAENVKNSKVIKGFPWKLEPIKYFNHQMGEEWLCFGVTNRMSDESMFWLCDSQIFLTIKHSTDASKNIYSGQHYRFLPALPYYHFYQLISMEDFMDDPGFFVNDICRVEVSIKVLSMSGKKFRKQTKIDWQNDIVGADCCLVIEGTNFYVGKHFLARHSSYFESMFYGSFKESTMETIVMHDLRKDYFEMVLNWLHRGGGEITELNVWGILEVAHRFDITSVIDEAEKFLVNTNALSRNERLVMSDKFGLHCLRDKCLADFSSIMSIVSLKDSLFWPELNPDTQQELLNNAVKIGARAEEERARQAALNTYPPTYNQGPPTMPNYSNQNQGPPMMPNYPNQNQGPAIMYLNQNAFGTNQQAPMMQQPQLASFPNMPSTSRQNGAMMNVGAPPPRPPPAKRSRKKV
ncbi:hypothetical protein PFISCL1PPCAC_26346 [Pristionchus fissidentatus]|uniref:BTB domain-containing protein n=1 Tax=Pristionchus fissidentatus TaxID=1538716 RepID=A0AAV5WZY5_9BILA|nr:hypothetical protein PFISCL1PPCAC_26346 [Pristionchus fissidentatus]